MRRPSDDNGAISGPYDENVFLSYSYRHIPENHEQLMGFCKFLYGRVPRYKEAAKKMVRYFVTKLEFPRNDGISAKDQLENYFTNILDVTGHCMAVGDDHSAYGNAFSYIYYPFTRYLIPVDKEGLPDGTPSRFNVEAVEEWDLKFDLSKMRYSFKHPETNQTIWCDFEDMKSKNEKLINLRRLDPRYVRIRHNRVSGKSQYVWIIDPDIKSMVKAGELFYANDLPRKMLECIRDNQYYQFPPDRVFHFRTETISGTDKMGWGFPGVLGNLPSIYQIMIYQKIDEAVGLDYMLPMRIFSPVASAGSQAPDALTFNWQASWATHMSNMIATRRRDPFAMFAVPMPVQYQEAAATGKQLVTNQLMEYHMNNLLYGMGYPVEFHNSTLRIDQVSTTIKLFENSYKDFLTQLNALVRWIGKSITSYMGWKDVEVQLEKPSVAYDIQKEQLLMQMASAGDLSKGTLLQKLLGIDDAMAEKQKAIEEQFKVEQIGREAQERAEGAQIGTPELAGLMDPDGDNQGGGGQGAPGGGGGGQGGNVTPGDLAGQAQQLAEQWMQIQGDGERRKAMQAAESQDMAVASYAKNIYNKMLQQAESGGRQQMRDQAQQQKTAGIVDAPKVNATIVENGKFDPRKVDLEKLKALLSKPELKTIPNDNVYQDEPSHLVNLRDPGCANQVTGNGFGSITGIPIQ